MVEATAAAAAEDPGCVMAHLLGAYLALMSTEEGAVAGAREALARAGTAGSPGEAALRPRERAHLAAARRWAGGDMTGAGATARRDLRALAPRPARARRGPPGGLLQR